MIKGIEGQRLSSGWCRDCSLSLSLFGENRLVGHQRGSDGLASASLTPADVDGMNALPELLRVLNSEDVKGCEVENDDCRLPLRLVKAETQGLARLVFHPGEPVFHFFDPDGEVVAVCLEEDGAGDYKLLVERVTGDEKGEFDLKSTENQALVFAKYCETLKPLLDRIGEQLGSLLLADKDNFASFYDSIKADMLNLTFFANTIFKIANFFPGKNLWGLVNHEIFSPLSKICQFMDTFDEFCELDPSGDNFAEDVEDLWLFVSKFRQSLIENFGRLNRMILDFVPKLMATNFDMHRFMLAPVVASASEVVGGRMAVEIDFDQSLEATFHPLILQMVVQNLLYNAQKAGATQARVTGEIESDRVILRVHDNANLIPDEIVKNLAHKPVAASVDGSGTGLYLTNKALRSFPGGDFRLNQRPGLKCFEIVMPSDSKVCNVGPKDLCEEVAGAFQDAFYEDVCADGLEK